MGVVNRVVANTVTPGRLSSTPSPFGLKLIDMGQRCQPYTQVVMYLIYQDFNKRTHLRSFVINQSIIEAAQDLCIRLTAGAWERGETDALNAPYAC